MPPYLPDTGARSEPESGERRHLLFLGIVRPYKGVDVLLRALAEGAPGDVTLTVAGEFWGGSAELTELADRLGVADRVRFREGYVPAEELPELFAAADAMVLPYRSATASQNVWLAHEHGLPVIATRAGALADHVREGGRGSVRARRRRRPGSGPCRLLPPGDAGEAARRRAPGGGRPVLAGLHRPPASGLNPGGKVPAVGEGPPQARLGARPATGGCF